MAVLRSDGVGCDWKRVGFDGGEAVQRVGIVGNPSVGVGLYWVGDGGRRLVECAWMEGDGVWE